MVTWALGGVAVLGLLVGCAKLVQDLAGCRRNGEKRPWDKYMPPL
jgi:hypothetical protein